MIGIVFAILLTLSMSIRLTTSFVSVVSKFSNPFQFFPVSKTPTIELLSEHKFQHYFIGNPALWPHKRGIHLLLKEIAEIGNDTMNHIPLVSWRTITKKVLPTSIQAKVDHSFATRLEDGNKRYGIRILNPGLSKLHFVSKIMKTIHSLTPQLYVDIFESIIHNGPCVINIKMEKVNNTDLIIYN